MGTDLDCGCTYFERCDCGALSDFKCTWECRRYVMLDRPCSNGNHKRRKRRWKKVRG